ncbi:branched chain amino acid aminotransferase apoenzyme [Microlunatus sagamiharensis]|uniref:Branched-chain-amino-acid aminotransferase n=1 Tax=Microlunatus sagamiharensis TaxID=546874 RepID=A0A1H2LY40_9ACTN|nr:branched-chain amino acid aminotransferase [Microlunatus sagamiharensis]SDU85645.1 branched chain amino acid aminotransferase apoenzyme [Microlunatus sagamiharensis]
MSLPFDLRPHPSPRSAAERAAVLADPGFGVHFTDHMALATWTAADGWHDSGVVPYGPFTLDPATAVLHYAQEIFEGLKAYRHADGSVWLFRPDQNAARLARSARRMALPELSQEDFLASIDALVAADEAWVPEGARSAAQESEQSLYLRPFMFASESFLGVRAARRVTYCAIASPAGPYFASGVHPVRIWITTTYNRSGPGGTGAAKTGGNYAASLLAQAEAAEKGFDQVMFTDAVERRWVEELGGMNVYLVTADNELVTPALSGTILEGVTRDSILTLASEFGLTPVERQVALDEMLEGIDSGHVTEVFACGTAAVITPIGLLADEAGEHKVSAGVTGEVTAAIRKNMLDVQYGRAEDTHGWMRRSL